MPLLMRRYGLKPWELDRLTANELDALQDDLAAFVEALSKEG